jgi:single-stranded DNA-binding protein
MFEQITIVGNLGRDPDGERVTWYKVACWGKLAEVTNEYLAKGRRVLAVTSRIEAVTTEGRRILSTRRASRVQPSE